MVRGYAIKPSMGSVSIHIYPDTPVAVSAEHNVIHIGDVIHNDSLEVALHLPSEGAEALDVLDNLMQACNELMRRNRTEQVPMNLVRRLYVVPDDDPA